MPLKPAAAACTGGSWQGGLYNLEQPESALGLELRLPAWPLPSSGSPHRSWLCCSGRRRGLVLLGAPGAGKGRDALGAPGWDLPGQAGQGRDGSSPPIRNLSVQPAVPLERQNGIFRSTGVPPAPHSLFFLLLKMLLACVLGGAACFARTLPPDNCHHALPCSPLLGVTPCPAGPGWSPSRRRAVAGGAPETAFSWHRPWVGWGLRRAGDVPPAPSQGSSSAHRSLERRARFSCLRTSAWAAALLPRPCGTGVC